MSLTRRIPVGAVIALLLTSCDWPFGGNCACTEKVCFQGVAVTLDPMPDTAHVSEIVVAIAYDDTLESQAESWSVPTHGTYWFNSRKVLRQRPAKIGVRIDYRLDGEAKSYAADRNLDWTEFTCNQCTGSAHCSDEKNHKAEARVDISAVP